LVHGELYATLNQQASLLSYYDCFVGLLLAAAAGVMLALPIKSFRSPGNRPRRLLWHAIIKENDDFSQPTGRFYYDSLNDMKKHNIRLIAM
jgi:hypothetical protein